MESPDRTTEGPRPSETSDVNTQVGRTDPEISSKHTPSQWRPFYLRASTLCGFISVFTLLIIAVEVLHAISRRSSGLTSSRPELRYLWTYGPTTVFTLLAAVWARVNFQAMLAAPWLALYRDPGTIAPAAKRDYLSMIQPIAIYKSIKNHDWPAAASSLITLLITALVAFSTGLIALSPTEIRNQASSVMIHAKFSDTSRLDTSLPAAANVQNSLIGFLRAGLPFPMGLTDQVAYETVSTNLSVNEVLISSVDGLSASLDCQSSSMETPLWDLGEYLSWVAILQPINLTLKGEDCQLQISVPTPLLDIQSPSVEATQGTAYFATLGHGSCDGAPNGHDAMRFGLIFGTIEQTANPDWKHSDGSTSPGTVRFVNTSQVICKPNYTVNRYTVIQNGTDFVSLKPSPTIAPRGLEGLHAWELAEAYLEMHQGTNPFDGDAEYIEPTYLYMPKYGKGVFLDRWLLTAMVANPALPDDLTSFVDPNLLSNFFRDHYQSYVAVVSHYLMPPSTPVPAHGITLHIENRLIVQSSVAHIISCLLGVAILLTIPIILCSRDQYLTRSPSTIIGSATLLSSLRPELVAHEYPNPLSLSNRAVTATSHISELKTRTVTESSSSTQKAYTTHRPIPIRPLTRLLVCLLVIGIIITLAILLKQSTFENRGLGDGRSNGSRHYLWTVSPALVFSLMGMHSTAADFAIRALSPYFSLKKGSGYTTSLGLDLLNKYQLRALYGAARFRLYLVLVAGLVALLTSTLPMLSASLFSVAVYPQQFQTNLLISSVFDKQTMVEGGLLDRVLMAETVPGYWPLLAKRISSLVLQDNLSFPLFTYRDLAFPTFDLPKELHSNWSNIAIETIIPALQFKLSCKLYDRGDMHKLDVNISSSGAVTQLNSIVIRSGNPPTLIDLIPKSEGPIVSKPGVFGLGLNRAGEKEAPDRYIYIWGDFQPQNPNGGDFPSLFALGCNESVDIVDTEVHFIHKGGALVIDPYFPPIINDSSRRVTRSGLAQNWIQSLTPYPQNVIPQLPSPTDTSLDEFFSVLTTSPYGVPLSALTGPSRNEAQIVAEAIQSQQQMMAAQYYSQIFRVAVDSSNFTVIDPAMAIEGRNPRAPFPALAINSTGTFRVMQDPASTYALISVLSIILVLVIISWLLMRDTPVLGGSATDVAYLYKLLLPGGILEALPENASTLQDGELEELFPPDARFKLGKQAGEGNANRYMIYQEQALEVDDLLMPDEDVETLDGLDQDTPRTGSIER